MRMCFCVTAVNGIRLRNRFSRALCDGRFSKAAGSGVWSGPRFMPVRFRRRICGALSRYPLSMRCLIRARWRWTRTRSYAFYNPNMPLYDRPSAGYRRLDRGRGIDISLLTFPQWVANLANRKRSFPGGVTVARQILVLFVGVQILPGKLKFIWPLRLSART